MFGIWGLLGLAELVLWLVLVFKAYQHEMFKLPIVGDQLYGGRELFLSDLKSAYHLKPGRTERPLISTTALHAEELSLKHPVTQDDIKVTAAWPKDLRVALKYLRLHAAA